MLLVPRLQEFSRGVSVNALGFAGALLVKDDEQLGQLRRAGPWTMLKDTRRSRSRRTRLLDSPPIPI